MQKTNDPTVFIVDDDPDFLTALALMLESTGLRVETFPGAQESSPPTRRTGPAAWSPTSACAA